MVDLVNTLLYIGGNRYGCKGLSRMLANGNGWHSNRKFKYEGDYFKHHTIGLGQKKMCDSTLVIHKFPIDGIV